MSRLLFLSVVTWGFVLVTDGHLSLPIRGRRVAAIEGQIASNWGYLVSYQTEGILVSLGKEGDDSPHSPLGRTGTMLCMVSG